MFNPRDPSLRSLAYFPLKIFAAEWVTYVAVMAYSSRDLEPSSNLNPNLQEELNRLSSNLRILQGWRRRVLTT
ncbi:hypothetical protein GJ744_006305 [Endocarpon pusillum]|uniref:Uncharacterized protein n=1 Tax=Endocarpon pusillum TaxID=364733 RepID=A0A8H7E0U2_9EURO|nr:hypothetical protein GJ744_006305 [Endocarpon pusillum]